MKFKRCSKNMLIPILMNATLWLVLIAFINRLPASKYNKFELTDDKFHRKLKTLENASFTARNAYINWYTNNQQDNRTFLFSKLENSSTKYLCTVLLAKQRHGTDISFTSISLAALLTRTSLTHENEIDLVAYNVDKYKRNDLHAFEKLVRIKYMPPIPENIDGHYLAKLREARHYVEVLKTLYEQKCNYSLIIEDDAIAAFDWYGKLKLALESADNWYKNNWLCLKLFTSYSIIDLQKLIHPYSVIGILVLTVLLSGLMVLILKIFDVKLEKLLFAFLFANSLLFTSFLIATSARPAQLGVQQFDSGFGCVALVYPYSKIKGLYEYIDKVVVDYAKGKSDFFMPKDLLIENYKNENGFYELKHEPSLFQHIGLYSSLYFYDNKYVKKLFKSYSFEDDDRPIEFNPDFRLPTKLL